MINSLTFINLAAATWVEKLIEVSIVGSIISLSVWLTFRMFRTIHPTFRLWTWRLVALKFIIGLLWIHPIHLAVLGPQHRTFNPAKQMQAFNISNESSPTANSHQKVLNIQTDSKEKTDNSKQENPDEAQGLSTSGYVFLSWVTGVGLIYLYFVFQLVMMRRRKSIYREVRDESVLLSLKTLCKTYDIITPPKLVAFEGAGTPYLIGWTNPIIVIPSQFLRSYSSRELSLILSHELAHLKKRHLQWTSLAFFGFSLFFFHPVFWLVYRELQFTQELEADEFALTSTKEGAQIYGNTLLKVVRSRQYWSESPFLALGVVESYQTLKRRIIHMKNSYSLSRKARWAAGSLFVLSCIVGIIPWKMVATAGSNSFSVKCSELSKCIKAVSEITGDKYIFDPHVQGAVNSSDNIELTKDNATLLLTKALYMNGFTRVPFGEPNTYEIARQRDARDGLLPKYSGSADLEPRLPDTWDVVQFTYKAKYLELTDEMARKIRSFMPPNARIIPFENTGKVVITDGIPGIKNVYEILKDMDQKPSKELLEKWKKRDSDNSREKRSVKTEDANKEQKGNNGG